MTSLPRPPLRRQILPSAEAPHHDHSERGDGSAEALVLARQYSGAGKPDRARGDLSSGPELKVPLADYRPALTRTVSAPKTPAAAIARDRAPADPRRRFANLAASSPARPERPRGWVSSGRRCSRACRNSESPVRRSEWSFEAPACLTRKRAVNLDAFGSSEGRLPRRSSISA